MCVCCSLVDSPGLIAHAPSPRLGGAVADYLTGGRRKGQVPMRRGVQFDPDGDGKLDIYEIARAFRALPSARFLRAGT